MMRLPIAKQLKKRSQIDVAFLQDEIMDILYSISDDLILHGGTAIWRCYNGKRFSEDIDLYSRSFPKFINSLREKVVSHGLLIPKIKDTGNVIFSNIHNNKSTVKVEINHSAVIQGSQMKYEMADGSNIEILSLTADQFVMEKILAYSDRRYIRDLYDIYHLTGTVPLEKRTKESLLEFLGNILDPVDESVLKTLVYSGLPPTFDHMKRGIMRSIQ